MATLSENTDLETILASIHLERYLESFQRSGYLRARDLFELDQAALNQLGITATGHRKRILKLAERIRRAEGLLDLETAAPPPPHRCQSESAIHLVSEQEDREGPSSPQRQQLSTAELQRNSSVPSIPSVLEGSSVEPEVVPVKPVPKPRTVFHRSRTEPPFSPSTPEQESPLPKGLSQECLFLAPPEGSVSQGGSCKGPSASDPFLPPVPPRLHRGVPPAMFRSLPSPVRTEPDSPTTPLRPSPPGSPSCRRDPSLRCSNPSPASPQGTLEMVSNEIYCGAAAVSAWNRPVPQPPPRQELGISLDRNGTSSSSFAERPQRIVAPLCDQEDTISPYCETVFPSQRNQDAKVTRSRSEGESGEPKREAATRKGDAGPVRFSQPARNESQGYCAVGDPPPILGRCLSVPPASRPGDPDEEQAISPYASYTSLSERTAPILSGWLDKLSPQGNYVFQKRYVKFDGRNLTYFGSEKEVYPKGVIPLAAIQMARAAKDYKFEVVTNHRTFVFRADNEALRNEWCDTLKSHVKEQLVFGRPRFGPGTHCQKTGYLELKGTKSKVYAAIVVEEVWLYKNEQCFKNGIGITVIEARGSTIREGKNKSFDLITPHKTFSFTAESERDKKDWMEALQESIAETLSDYEVAEKIWSNRSNKVCADCRAISPDWASINLCVVICKNCAGQHRSLGTMVSKVQSLKLDTSVWSNEIVQLFIMLGNDRANEFWSARLPPAEEIDCDATPEQRREFVALKYRQGRYRRPHPGFATQEELLKALCTAVTEQNLLKTVTSIFAEAEAADRSGANGLDKHDHGSHATSGGAEDWTQSVYDEITQPVLHAGYIYKSGSMSKGTLSRKTREDFQKFWCSVEKAILFYESDRCHEPSMKIEVKDVVCLGVSRPDVCSSTGFIDRFRYTLELCLSSEKLYQFGLETPDTLHSWAKAIGKAATPISCHCLLAREFERVGVLRYKAMLDPRQWKEGFFVLQKCNLFMCPGDDGAAEDIINLKRLQELSIASQNDNNEKRDILVLVEKGRTLYLQGMGRTDFSLWYADIQKAAGGKGNALKDQQLSRNDIPIIVDSCIAFITQYGLGHEGIYRKNGAKSRIKLLMEDFRRDARNVKLRIGDNFIEDVTDVLKRFFREIDDPIFMADLHPLWKEAAKISNKVQRLDRYKELIRGLPRVNRTTLAALISHLYRVQKCADLNQMCTKNLSLLFAPSLFQTDGKGEHEVKIIEDLIDNYLYVFEIDEEQQTQIELEVSLITTWKDTQLSQAGDLIIEVYLEKKTPDSCITLKVSPTMCAEELTNQVLYMRNVPAGEKDVWLTFEAIEDGELERPLHPKEKVLEQALQWCKMADPSSAYLLVKKVPRGEAIHVFTGYKSEVSKSGVLKCREEPPKLLQGNKFQERTFQIREHKLLLLKDKKSNKAEKEWHLKTLKIYLGVRKKLKAPSRWGFTVLLDKQQLYLCCSSESELWEWMISFLKAQHDDLQAPVLRRHSASDLSKQKFGTMPLVPIRGDESNSPLLSANQTLRKLHARRTLSMFFPMKAQQDSFEERAETPEPLYEEVGDMGLQVPKPPESSFHGGAQRPLSLCQRKTASLDRMVGPNPVRLLPPASSLDALYVEEGRGPEAGVTLQPFPCRKPLGPGGSSQNLLLRELSTVFGRKAEDEDESADAPGGVA
ncbi:arf-GAP with Rho-GAP domain, ANK repeat and PH domain-containing protein 3 isoform X1 [Scleropages formosus]|uniref:ArfGAP with RhoGAP domain, ankyrin repeat and PH domain 3 n=1 Tax=Scleropages formosus TaxID=113540 RepID=A0A8C9WGZ9_SCLFO|nr:arf-GAP with Rho-GAP domain, ANK repeat and PH domain-containing protein 3 isoform X1 [Scleropages formosus]XP_029113095.1 arf-GAP with Rho-GAP domain, ANK repeat and PH domain-containing protein 3 isoform X1 [Scleropages formosus]